MAVSKRRKNERTPRRHRSTETPARILQAADELFTARGFAAVSVRDVAQAAGVNKALVFYHFQSKEALFEKVLELYYARHTEALASVLAAEGDLRERLHNVLDAYLDFIEDNLRYPALVQREIASGSDVRAPIQRGQAMLYEWFERTFAGFSSETGPLSTRQFFVSIMGLVITYYVSAPVLDQFWSGDPLSVANRRERREHLHWVVDTLLARLAAEAPAENN